jgi:hypothetical protein
MNIMNPPGIRIVGNSDNADSYQGRWITELNAVKSVLNKVAGVQEHIPSSIPWKLKQHKNCDPQLASGTV